MAFSQYLNFTLQEKGNYYSKDFLLFFRSYIVFAGTSIQPGEPYKVAVTLFRNSNKKTYSFPFGPYDNLPATIQVQISRKGSVLVSKIRECHFGSTELIIVTVKFTFPYKNVLPWIVPPLFSKLIVTVSLHNILEFLIIVMLKIACKVFLFELFLLISRLFFVCLFKSLSL